MNNFTTPKRFSEVPNLLTADQIKEAMRKGTTIVLKSTAGLEEAPDGQKVLEPVDEILVVQGLLGAKNHNQAVHQQAIDEVLGETVKAAENDSLADAVVAKLETEEKALSLIRQQAKYVCKSVVATTVHTGYENYLRPFHYGKIKRCVEAVAAAVGNSEILIKDAQVAIAAGADFVLEMKNRYPETGEPAQKIPESVRLKNQVDPLEEKLATLLERQECCKKMQEHYDAEDELILSDNSTMKILMERREEGVAPKTYILITAPSGEWEKITNPEARYASEINGLRQQLAPLHEKLAEVLRVETIYEKLLNLKVGDILVSKNSRREVVAINGDMATVVYNGKEERTISISRNIKWGMPAIREIISAEKAETVRDPQRTHIL